MFTTIDRVTVTVSGGVYWCFLLSFIIVVLIMIMILINGIAFFVSFFFSYLLINYYLFWAYFHFICLLLNIFLFYMLLLLLFAHISGTDFCLIVWMLPVHWMLDVGC